MEKEEIQQIRQSPLFDGISDKDLPAMLKCTGCYTHFFNKGEPVYSQEEEVKTVGIVLCGHVQMLQEDIWGRKTILTAMDPGDMFGETFACGSETTSKVTFLCTMPSKILMMPFHHIMNMCSNACSFHNKLIENMVRMIAVKNGQLMQKVEILSKRTLREKILAYLSREVQKQKSQYLDIPMGRIELAEYLGADRSALSRELSRMKEDGLIDYDRNTFRLIKTEV
ncbi:MAG: Crp/Fnr family transcriptional regulator [Eubacterium sp.]|nr:Crp/Fnr family transcriptional regulator [Eubacterium sp.]